VRSPSLGRAQSSRGVARPVNTPSSRREGISPQPIRIPERYRNATARQAVTRMFGARQNSAIRFVVDAAGEEEMAMDFWVWVAVIAGAVVALVLLFFVVGTPGRRRAAKREQAERLRQEAEEKLRSAAGRDAAARQEEAAAERERLAAQEQLEEADAVDPDLPAQASRPDATVRRQPEAADETA
jgi:hypothetical protein